MQSSTDTVAVRVSVTTLSDVEQVVNTVEQARFAQRAPALRNVSKLSLNVLMAILKENGGVLGAQSQWPKEVSAKLAARFATPCAPMCLVRWQEKQSTGCFSI